MITLPFRVRPSRRSRTRRSPLLVERLEDRTLLAGNLFIDGAVAGTADNHLWEYTQDGQLLGSQPLNDTARGLSVDPSGNVNIFDGTFNPQLATYSPTANTWSYQTYPGWSTANVTDYGGVVAYKTFVFATDTFTYNGGEPMGLFGLTAQAAGRSGLPTEPTLFRSRSVRTDYSTVSKVTTALALGSKFTIRTL